MAKTYPHQMDGSRGESAWSAPDTVAGFAASAANATLMAFARAELQRGGTCALDLGCGAARNAVPLAKIGWTVTGIDLSRPMLDAAAERGRAAGVADRVRLELAPMGAVPLPDASVDLIVARDLEPRALRERVPRGRPRGGACRTTGRGAVRVHVFAPHASRLGCAGAG
jgi:SAM-dependent methyltransferase